jgi:hypothetical protein
MGLFDGIVQREISVRGTPARSPLFYRDLAMMLAIFPARLRTASALLPSARLQALSPIPGKALVAVSCFEYRDTDIGPYNEVSVAVAADVNGGRAPGLVRLLRSALSREYTGYVVDLPVDTEVALYGGLDYFNFPKFLVDIRFSEDGGHRTCSVRDREGGTLIFELCGRKLPTRTRRPSRRRGTSTFVSFPWKDGALRRATLLVDEIERGTEMWGGFQIALGSHPSADRLAALELGRPLFYTYVPLAQAVLWEPELLAARRG